MAQDPREYTNPRATNARREKEANGVDAGDLPGPAKDMFTPGSQAKFSGYTADRKKSGPPADMLKRRASKE